VRLELSLAKRLALFVDLVLFLVVHLGLAPIGRFRSMGRAS
jgi:hypothetical protein